MPWDTNRPTDNDLLSDLPNEWQQTKTAIGSYLTSMVYWGDSATSAGYPRLSTTTAAPVTARIFSVPRSEVSSRGRVDLFYVTDEKRLVYMDSSGNSIAIGGPQAIVSYHTLGGSSRNLPQMEPNTKTVVCSGSVTTSNGNLLIANVTYGVTYGAPPQVMVTSSSTNGSSGASYFVAASQIGVSTCSLTAQYAKNLSASTINNVKWYWRSTGTVTL